MIGPLRTTTTRLWRWITLGPVAPSVPSVVTPDFIVCLRADTLVLQMPSDTYAVRLWPDSTVLQAPSDSYVVRMPVDDTKELL